MKSYLKSEIARAAGVSYRTFQRWLQQQSEQLSQWVLHQGHNSCHPWR